ncbi:MAG TPA: DUF4147 domain-containing protein [Candidatus Eisenbacteria bacterium]|nr:DUF4147 domain-containing protein [Candidatus Eisenbacteria bacterium]
MNASAMRRALLRIHAAAMDAADPRRAVARALSVRGRTLRAGNTRASLGPGGRVFLIAIGKAALGMTRGALERVGPLVTDGAIVHPEGARPGSSRPRALRFLPGSHPVPTRASLRAGRAAAACAAGARPGDVVLVLLSGGGSAMAEWPRPGLRIADLRRATRELQRAGADIHALNTVRRALSRLKGGGLARLAGGAGVLTLALSDVVGDKPEAIASGPTVPSPTGLRDAIEVLRRFGLERKLQRTVEALRRAAHEPGPGRSRAARPGKRGYAIVGSNRACAAAAARAARDLGIVTRRIGAPLTGEAREAGAKFARAALRLRAGAAAGGRPRCLIAGGETTVTMRAPGGARGRGRGGRNLELALGAAGILRGEPGVALLSFATDGWDGTSGAAGAYATGSTWARALRLRRNPDRALATNDTAPLFRALGDLLVTGPSGTNVNDLTVALIAPPRRRSPRRARSR